MLTAKSPSGGRGRKFKSSHPDQLFFIILVSCCHFGSQQALTNSLLPEFSRTLLPGKFPASTIINPCYANALRWLAHEHCLGSAVSHKPPSSKPGLLRRFTYKIARRLAKFFSEAAGKVRGRGESDRFRCLIDRHSLPQIVERLSQPILSKVLNR